MTVDAGLPWIGTEPEPDDVDRIAARLGRTREDVLAAIERLRDAGRIPARTEE